MWIINDRVERCFEKFFWFIFWFFGKLEILNLIISVCIFLYCKYYGYKFMDGLLIFYNFIYLNVCLNIYSMYLYFKLWLKFFKNYRGNLVFYL